MDDAVDRYHTVYHGSFHPIPTRPGPQSTQRWLESILGHCQDRGVPFYSGADWVRFNDARRGLRLVSSQFSLDDATLDLTFEAPLPAEGLTLALPHVFRGRALHTATVDGEPVPVTPQALEGRQQVMLSADYAAGQRRRWHLVWGPPT